MKITIKNIKLFAALTGFVISLTLISAPKALAATADECGEWHKLAVSIMENRQLGTPIASMLEVANKHPTHSRQITVMIAAAYDVRIFSSLDGKVSIVNDFANTIFMICYEANGKRI